MTGKRGREFSRRDLFGIFGRGTKGFRDSIERAAPQLDPGAAPAAKRTTGYARKNRPPADTLPASPDGQGGHLVDLRPQPLTPGQSCRIIGAGLTEPLLAVRVNATHCAVVSGECPIDGSDILWLAFEDRAACPSCGSRWRLDGNLTRGPAECGLATYLVDETAGLLRLRATR